MCDGSRWHCERRGIAVGFCFLSFSLFLMFIMGFVRSLLPFGFTSLFSFSHRRFYSHLSKAFPADSANNALSEAGLVNTKVDDSHVLEIDTRNLSMISRLLEDALPLPVNWGC